MSPFVVLSEVDESAKGSGRHGDTVASMDSLERSDNLLILKILRSSDWAKILWSLLPS